MSDGPVFQPATADEPSVATETDQRNLWMVLKIYVGGDCPLTAVDPDIEKINLQQINGECRADIVTDDTDMAVLHTKQPMGKDCLGWAFHEHGCVPHIMDADDESITISVYHEDRETVPELVESLRETGYVVDVKRLVGVDRKMVEESTVLCNLSVLTEKQREAVDLAKERGYYDRCADACMESMAEELDISKSALSRRLKSAEAKLMLELIGQSG
jgi:hypothetical protein